MKSSTLAAVDTLIARYPALEACGTDIRPQGSAPQSAAPMDITPPTSALDAGDSPRAIADRYRNR